MQLCYYYNEYIYIIFSIDLPNAQDRMDIINFHLKKPRENGRLAADVSMTNLQQLVNATENFSGADLAQVVRIAITEANRRLLKVSPFNKYLIFISIILVIIGNHHKSR